MNTIRVRISGMQGIGKTTLAQLIMMNLQHLGYEANEAYNNQSEYSVKMQPPRIGFKPPFNCFIKIEVAYPTIPKPPKPKRKRPPRKPNIWTGSKRGAR